MNSDSLRDGREVWRKKKKKEKGEYGKKEIKRKTWEREGKS
jgi:hypothetical protein